MSNATVYEHLGVRTIVNAKGTATRVSGGLMAPEVAEAMAEATRHCVDMGELQARASALIAQRTGAEAGIVTSGAAAALLLGTAACITGLDPGRINRLPDTRGMRDRVVVARSQRNFYDHAVRAAGVELLEVGIPDRFSGAGVRDAEAWEIADAIDERTACVLHVAQPHARPRLPEVAEVAHAAGVPVLVDAAAQLPPVSNLRRFVDEGADVVAFSGGKAILGPQGTGILCGRRDLVAAAALHNLDHDVHFEQWRPPPGLIDKADLRGLPQHGIGRACKVGKEQIVGLLVALERFDEAELARRNARAEVYLDAIESALAPALPARVERYATDPGGEPRLRLVLAGDAPLDAMGLVVALQDGEPSIQVDSAQADANAVVVVPTCLEAGHTAAIASAVNRALGAGA